MIELRNIRGRYPERRIRLQAEDMHISLRPTDTGVTQVRLDSKADDAFWLEFEVVERPFGMVFVTEAP